MSKTLKNHKRKQRRANKTQRLSGGMTGGREFVFNGNRRNTGELNALMGQPNHHVLAKHYSNTCIHCKNLEPEWEEVIRQLNPHPSLTVANLDPKATDYMNEHHYSKHNYGVNGIPTIVYIHEIKMVKPQEYQGERTAKAIMAWVTKIMADNNLEMTIKHKSEPVLDEPLVSEPVSEPVLEPVSEPVLEPVSEPPLSEEPAQNAFPPAPLSDASSVLSNATQTVKDAAAKVDQTISNGVDSVKSALTNEFDIGETIGNLFSSSSTASVPPPAPALDQDLVPGPANAPLVPSLVGGKTSRRTRRKNRRSKSNKKSKKSKSKK